MSLRAGAAVVLTAALILLAILLNAFTGDPILGQPAVATPLHNLATLALWGAAIAAVVAVVLYVVDRRSGY